jgi:hypothetical protein
MSNTYLTKRQIQEAARVRSTAEEMRRAKCDTNPYILAELSRHKDEDVRYEIANNPNTPKDILAYLAIDMDWSIRCAIARNQNSSVETLIHLAESEDADVLHRVANNPSTPEMVKLYLKNPGFAGLTLAEFWASTNG